MKKLLASMQNELTKLTSQKKYWVFPLIAAIAVVGFPLLGLIPGNVLQLSMSNYPYTVLSIVGYLLLPIIAFMMAADLLAGEEERGELKISLTYPISRTAILLGKEGVYSTV